MRLRDRERVEQILAVLHKHSWDAMVCARPMNVLLLSGYWPVLGNSVAVITSEGEVSVVTPEDEESLARLGWADHVYTFAAASLDGFKKLSATLSACLTPILKPLNACKVAYEYGAATEPATYVGMNVYGELIRELLGEVLPEANLRPASDELARLRAVLTTNDLRILRTACGIAKSSFMSGAGLLARGFTEAETAATLRARIGAQSHQDAVRHDGFCFCMSGPNSSQAYKAYQQSTSRPLGRSEFILLHCNSYIDGLWTDITRTFFLGEPTHRQREMMKAVLEARDAATAQVRPGIRASDVDCAARYVLETRGYGKAFRHATGHGVGFAAVDHSALPRIHPQSTDLLEPGMTFNIEPAIYIEGICGIRHCDMVTVTQDGCEILTNFQTRLDDLIFPCSQRADSSIDHNCIA